MISNSFSLKKYNTFGIEAFCKELIHITSNAQLRRVIDSMHEPVRVLGEGSNVLLTGDLPYAILINRIKGIRVINESDKYVLVEVGGGHNWHEFVLWSVGKGLGGVENLALIPGTVGAAPIQNIGAYGVEQSNSFVSLTAVHLESGKDIILHEDDCRFGYRDSVFKQSLKGKYMITSVTYRLLKQPDLVLDYGVIREKLAEHRITSPVVGDICDIIMEIRKSKLPDPKILGNSGSFFKNPIIPFQKFLELESIFPGIPSYPAGDNEVKLAAGWLIERCGWKGKRIGNTGAYEKQALVLVNYGQATGAEIWDLARKIIKDVEEKFGIVLIPEVNIW